VAPLTRGAQPVRELHSFLVLPENQMAQTAVRQLLGKPREEAFPIVTVFGPAETGKSRLGRELARQFSKTHSDIKVLQVTADEFTRQLHEASTTHRVRAFQRRYRDEPLLLVFEDLHDLEGRRESQLQLLAILDDQQSQGGRVLMTSRRSPGESPNLSPRIVNRLHGGICVEVEPLDIPSRQALASHVATELGIPLPDSLTSLIAKEGLAAPGAILRLVTSLRTSAQERKTSIDAKLIRELIGGSRTSPKSISDITKAVAREFSSKVADLRSPGRSQSLVIPRHVAMYLSRDLLRAEFAVIGEYFSGRNHATVMHACDKVRDQIEKDADFRTQVARIRESLAEA
jgi:chromosomal replication initiator protein